MKPLKNSRKTEPVRAAQSREFPFCAAARNVPFALITRFGLVLSLLAGLAFAAGIDGKWVSERKMERDGQAFTITQTLDLKTDGSKLSGSITTAFGDQERKSDIKDGKIDGSKFTFSATMMGPNGESKVTYEGTIDGDSIKGTSSREGGQSRPFEAKRK